MPQPAKKQKFKPQNKKTVPAIKAEDLVSRSDAKRNQAVMYILLFLSLILVYFNSFRNELIMNWDDVGYIVDNEYIKSLSFDNIKKIFSEFYMSNYHPFTTLSYALEYHFVKENVFLYHFDNFILHAINTLLVFRLIRKIYPDEVKIAFFTACVFAVHPMHVESVAWISERKDMLYTLFFLLGLEQYQRYFVETKKNRFLIFSFLFFICSLMSKSAAVIFPVVLFAFDYFNKRKITWPLFIEKLPFFALSVLFGLLALWSQKGAIQNLSPMLEVYERILILIYTLITYIWKFFAPLGLSAMYPYPLLDGGHLPFIYFTIPIFLLALAYFVFRMRKNRAFVFGMAFFLINLLLVLQFVPVGGVILSERYTYVPYIGLAFAMAVLLKPWLEKRKTTIISILVLWVVLIGFLANQRVSFWKNGDVLFTDVIKKYPRLPYAYNNRGFLYWDFYSLKKYSGNETMKKKYSDKALNDFSTAISLDPTYTDAYMNRAILLYNTGRPADALKDFNSLLKLDSMHTDGLLGRANTYSTLAMYKEALPDYNRYLAVKKDADAKTYVWRGIAYQNTGDEIAAVSDFRKAIAIDKDYYESYYWLGIVSFQKKNYDSAYFYFSESHRCNPENAETMVYQGLCLFNQGKSEEAIKCYTGALKINPAEASAYVNRAVSLYQLDRYAEAEKDLITASQRGFPVDAAFFQAVKFRDPRFKTQY